MRKDDYIIDTHEFKIPVYSDYIENKAIWCFAKENINDEDVFYIYHDIEKQSRYTRVSMNSSKYIYDENMMCLSKEDIRWLMDTLCSYHKEFRDKTVWEYMISSYSFESAVYNSINISENKKMPDYTKLK